MSGRLPAWFKQKLPDPKAMGRITSLVEGSSLHTICESALCPNSGECFARSTATFLILGDVCTRHCTFCAVKKGSPPVIDPDEPAHVLDAGGALGLRYAVITSVTRDDLADGGASHFASVVNSLHAGGVSAEILVPDFQGSLDSLRSVVASHPEVLNHNVETVPRLYSDVRPEAGYRRSLELLSRAKQTDPGMVTKSGLMVGLGETDDEVVQVMMDLRQVSCDIITIGQYLQPTPRHHPIERFVPPSQFIEYARIAGEMGFAGVSSAPLVRSSYHAAELFEEAKARMSGPHGAILSHKA